MSRERWTTPNGNRWWNAAHEAAFARAHGTTPPSPPEPAGPIVLMLEGDEDDPETAAPPLSAETLQRAEELRQRVNASARARAARARARAAASNQTNAGRSRAKETPCE